jgi:Domain of unknown function (DUF4189)
MLGWKKTLVFGLIALVGTVAVATPSRAEWIESGNEDIDGTRVHTTIYHERGYATFSNSCGSQTLTQRELEQGAKPTQIIPCPRRSTNTDPPPYRAERPRDQDSPHAGGKRLWAAVAAGIKDRSFGSDGRVSVGLARDRETRSEAEEAAVRKCEENDVSCQVVTAWNAGCYHITVSEDAENLVWGAGPTAQDAYDECYRRVKGGNCKTQTLGGCYPE